MKTRQDTIFETVAQQDDEITGLRVEALTQFQELAEVRHELSEVTPAAPSVVTPVVTPAAPPVVTPLESPFAPPPPPAAEVAEMAASPTAGDKRKAGFTRFDPVVPLDPSLILLTPV